MEGLSDFLSMGGYGRFIWPSFVLSAVVLGGLLMQSFRFLKSSEQELSALQGAPADENQAQEVVHEAQA